MDEENYYNKSSKGILTDKEIDNLIDEIMNIPVEKNNNCLSTYGSINVDDLINAVKELKKVPTYDELLKEIQQLKEQLQQKEDIINKVKNLVDPLKIEEPYNAITEQFKEKMLEILNNKGEYND